MGPRLDQVPPEAPAERIIEPVNGAHSENFWTEMRAQDIRVSRHFVGVSLFNQARALSLSLSLSGIAVPM